MIRILGLVFSFIWAIILGFNWNVFSIIKSDSNDNLFPPKNEKVIISHTLPDSIFTVVDSLNKLESSTKVEEVKKETEVALNNDGLGNNDLKKLLKTPVEVYFENISGRILKTNELENYLVLAKAYLSKNLNSKLRIIGHTDSEGSLSQNRRFALNRAIKLKKYLLNNGFHNKNLQIESKGETEPLAPNISEQNKAKNRRVSIVLK